MSNIRKISKSSTLFLKLEDTTERKQIKAKESERERERKKKKREKERKAERKFSIWKFALQISILNRKDKHSSRPCQ